MKKIYFGLILFGFFVACKKEKFSTVTSPPPQPTSVVPHYGMPHPRSAQPRLTNPEYIDSLLFVIKNGYQLQTTDSAAVFSSTDSHIIMSSKGLITRLTSAEVVPIVITWSNPKFAPTTIYALGATDDNQDYPFKHYQGALATDPFASYLMGWKTLQRLPVANETYAIVLRHADASCGADNPYSLVKNWWKLPDSAYARQLNQQGFVRATALGQIFKDLQYPITRVYTSEFNRARQTAQLMNMGPVPIIDSTINHPTHNNYLPGLFTGMTGILKKLPADNQMTLIVAHHPINELQGCTGFPSFPSVSPFNWTGAYLIKIDAGGQLTCEGSVSWGMFKWWHDLKIHGQ